MNRLMLIVIAILLLLLGVAGLYILNGGGAHTHTITNNIVRTDTVYKEKIKVITVQAPTPPAKVIIQTVRDTVYRKEVEKKDIIIGESIVNNQLHVQTIDTTGKVKETVTNIPEGTKELDIDGQGNAKVKERKKFRAWLDRSAKHVKNGLAVVGVVAIIIVVSVVASGG